MTTTREALLKSPLAFTPWGHRGTLSDLSLDVDGVSLNFSFDTFGELVGVSQRLRDAAKEVLRTLGGGR